MSVFGADLEPMLPTRPRTIGSTAAPNVATKASLQEVILLVNLADFQGTSAVVTYH